MKFFLFRLTVLLGLSLLWSVPASPAQTQPSTLTPIVRAATRYDTSRALLAQPIAPHIPPAERDRLPLPRLTLKTQPATTVHDRDPVLQTALAPVQMPAPLLNFDGQGNVRGYYPPDTNGDIGGDYYVQMVNVTLAIWRVDRMALTATLVYGPADTNTVWAGFGGVCEATNDGDPIVLYDSLAHRWLISQFALPNFPSGPFYECVAISQADDPTGAWHRYEFLISQTKMNDYPHFGVWPDGYYLTLNQFNQDSLNWAGAGVVVLERDQMLLGQPARMVYFDLQPVNEDFSGLLPADLDGSPPPPNTPNYFVEMDDDALGWPTDQLSVWEFKTNWANPGLSTFGNAGQPNVVLPVAAFDSEMCGGSSNCIPQPNGATRLDALADRLMFRLQYRHFGDYATLVTNHTVDVDSTDHAGLRWYELRQTDSAWSVYQQGTYAPADGVHRWMGSAALDHVGNLALGYSASSPTLAPSIRYTGRLAGDPLNTLPQGEMTLVTGGGVQTGFQGRWGDYSSMSVDPVDDCTFWYTNEYYVISSGTGWQTRLGAFKFPNCTAGPQGILKGQITEVTNNRELSGAAVQASASLTQSSSTQSNANGYYTLMLPVGVYSLTASLYGYTASTIANLTILSGTTTTQNLQLAPVPPRIVSGTVRDAQTGWALYSYLEIEGYPHGPLYNDPVTGFYSVSLASDLNYTLHVRSLITGYLPTQASVLNLAADQTLNFALAADLDLCAAPGYTPNWQTPAWSNDFESDDGGWMADQWGDEWQWGVPTYPPTLTAHSGVKVWGTNLDGPVTNTIWAHTLFKTLAIPPEGHTRLTWWEWVGINPAQTRELNIGEVWLYLTDAPIYAWTSQHIDLSAYRGQTITLRLALYMCCETTLQPGWYIDDMVLLNGPCQPSAGGLVLGTTYDENTSQTLNGVNVVTASGEKALTKIVGTNAAFYYLFVPSGAQILTATRSGGYATTPLTVTVVPSLTTRQDFYLPAGQLAYAPAGLTATLEMSQSIVLPLTLTNSGGWIASYDLAMLDRGLTPRYPLEQPHFVVRSFRQNMTNTRQIKRPKPPIAPLVETGEVLQSWPSHMATPWGINFDPNQQTVWVNELDFFGPSDRNVEFHLDGSYSGRVVGLADWVKFWAADMAYQPATQTMWQFNVGADQNCVHEWDPLTLAATGHIICPPSGVTQVGLAFDPKTDTFFSGGWGNGIVYRFDSFGAILEQVATDLAIAGLAYNPDTRHLFVMTNDAPSALYVLDESDHYALLKEITLESFADYGGAGLDLDCQGHLWAADQNTQDISEIASGEDTQLCQPYTYAWLSASPLSGTLPAHSSQSLTVTLDATGLTQPGDYHARLKAYTDTPYPSPELPITLTVLPPINWGKVTGYFDGLGYCDLTPTVPLSQATVLIESATNFSDTTKTDENGRFAYWLDPVHSPLTVTVSRGGFFAQQITGVTVTTGLTTETPTLTARRNAPCLTFNPSGFTVVTSGGRQISRTLMLTNTGGGEFTFSTRNNLSWLTVSPLSGSVAVGSVMSLTITFDVTQLWDGDYQIQVIFRTNDPQHLFLGIPVDLFVLPFTVGIAPEFNTRADFASPGTRLTYVLPVRNTGSVSDTFLISLTGQTWNTTASASLALPSGEQGLVWVMVDVPPNASEATMDTVTLTLTSQNDPEVTEWVTLMTTAHNLPNKIYLPLLSQATPP